MFTIKSLGVLATLALSLVNSGKAHLIMNTPIPFGKGTLNNSPLVDAAIGSAGSDFPCKQRPGVYDITTMNNMPVGAPQTLSFTGSASHGGGTCQIAVTMDPEPAVNSTWKIIQVYEGGCPTTADGNSGTHPFTFSIPKRFPNGRATLSWTWFNHIGNREIYQNCAPITVTGGADNHDYYDTLPNWYIINLPSSECSSVESTDQIIPNPGQFVLKGGAAASLASATGPSCAAAAAAQTKGVNGYKSASSDNGAAATASAGGTASAPTSAAAVASSANNGMYTLAGPGVAPSSAAAAVAPSDGLIANSPAAPAPTSMVTVSVAPSATASSAAPAYPTTQPAPGQGISGPASGAPAAAAPSSYSSRSGSTSCTTEGAVVCNGASQFGLCNHGQVVWEAVAPGTTCSNGVIQKRGALRHAHVRRHAQDLAHRRTSEHERDMELAGMLREERWE